MSVTLPEHLQERLSRLSGPPRPAGKRVVYWMRTAVRAHENPALDTAVLTSQALGVPLLVYHAVSERYPHASDRHHTFLLEGARDVSRALAERGISYALHVERPGMRAPYLQELAATASVVITEDMPVAPLLQWTRRLAEDAPVWVVDTACVVPMPLVGRAITRAFAFRRATTPLRSGRLERDWPEVTVVPRADTGTLPFEPIDAATMDMAALLAQCDIDHSVGPVPDTPGGSTAGYARWSAFRDGGLRAYAARRNNAADSSGVSRMSPYLHMGFVSPFRIARDAAGMAGKGPDKFLDELLVWRELAYVWCRYEPRHAGVEVLPDWARATLKRHEPDPRPQLPDLETLSRGKTGDRLWDAAQRSLLTHGELHNNVRMTWGKALLSWTPDARTALSTLLYLNNRYAMDGRDPASYAGIQWCLGAMDRPFQPEQPIIGSVRPRDTRTHARRMDLDKYERHMARPLRASPPRTAVVGGGLAGLVAARTLADHGYAVDVFDKGRGPGGRMSTRRRDGGAFDHGAQYFSARDPRFAAAVSAWEHAGVVAPWNARFAEVEGGVTTPLEPSTTRFVGTPSMSAVVRHLSSDVPVQFGVRVGAIAWDDGVWVVRDEAGAALGSFDAVVLAVPAPQAAALLSDSPRLAAACRDLEMTPCWAGMLTTYAPVASDFDAAHVRGGPLAWVSRDSSKPGRPSGERWVLHASEAWSRAHLEASREEVAAALQAALEELVGPVVGDTVAHRWRYALGASGLSSAWDDRGLALAGDWVGGGRVEDAFLSGQAAAGRLLGKFAAEARPVTVEEEARPQLGLFAAS